MATPHAHKSFAAVPSVRDDPRPAPFAVLNPRIPVGAIRFLGWSSNSSRFAWQQARPGQRVWPGGPVWVLRLDARGRAEQRAHFRDQFEDRLRKRGIRQRPRSVLPTDAVTERDVVIRTSRGELLAVALRDRVESKGTPAGSTPWIAVLHRLPGGYAPVTGIAAPDAVPPLQVEAWESPNRQRVVLAITTGSGRTARMQLATLPLGRWMPRSETHTAVVVPKAPEPTTLPDAASPTASPAAQKGPKEPKKPTKDEEPAKDTKRTKAETPEAADEAPRR